ncbi:MAG: hypothetical protein ABIS50_08395 [Luteolibacter sp.]|uniref:O-antigen ligase family protein n=1 Tax=Luteolibacter sp. TaxID=1962973 RepID=UPI003265F1E1
MFFSADPPDHIHIPTARNAIWVERLIWIFMMSFALDYRNSVAREGAGGAGIDQLLFLSSCIGSSVAILAIGWKYLIVRPGAWLVTFWGLFIAFMLCNSLLQGVPPGRSIRVILPLVFCLFGIMNAHIAGCMGIRPSKIVTPILAAACINILWRIVQGFLFKESTLETVRIEVQSPATNWLAAWIGCSILLRKRLHWTLPMACLVLFIGIFITVTRSLIFPVMASGLACTLCYLLGIRWGIFRWSGLAKRVLPLTSAVVLVVLALGIIAVVQPLMIERWNERLFHNAGTLNLGSDISYLTRKAEADAMWKILMEDPVHFIHGRGVGTSYYWDPAYMSEIWMVFPKDQVEFDDIWFAGHSIWTYGLLSGGVIALAAYVTLFVSTATFGLVAARANATHPGPDQWLAFLPFVATCCLLSESLTANPFQERLVGIIFGMMVGLPQAFMVRSSWIHTNSRQLPAN